MRSIVLRSNPAPASSATEKAISAATRMVRVQRESIAAAPFNPVTRSMWRAAIAGKNPAIVHANIDAPIAKKSAGRSTTTRSRLGRKLNMLAGSDATMMRTQRVLCRLAIDGLRFDSCGAGLKLQPRV